MKRLHEPELDAAWRAAGRRRFEAAYAPEDSLYEQIAEDIPKGKHIRMQQPFNEFTIYTIVKRETLSKAAENLETTEFHEGHPWTTGFDLWRQSMAANEAMAVIFADAADCSRLVFWGILTRVVIEGKNTRYWVKQMRKIKGRHMPQELILKSSGKNIAPNFIRPYAICRRPPFLPKRTPAEK
jgi:hypothetical protein